MNIVINDKQKLLSSIATDQIHLRLNDLLRRFEREMDRVQLTVKDVNGPRGGIDKECRILIKLKRRPDIAVSAIKRTLSQAIATAITRSIHFLSKRNERANSRRNASIAKMASTSK